MPSNSILFPIFVGVAAFTGTAAAIAHASGPPERPEDGHDRRHSTASGRGDLTVTVSGVTPGRGNIMVGLYDSSTDFWAIGKHRVGRVVPAAGGVNEAVFENVPYGRYAVAIIYDENRNGQLDMRLGMVPKEPLGFSNNATARFGLPKFDDAAFAVQQPRKTIVIAVR